MQLGFYFDQTRCTGCEACVVACKDWKDIPAGPAAFCRIGSLEEGRIPGLSLCFYPLGCLHCSEPQCLDICPKRAINKRSQDGVVVVKEELCLQGWRRCLDACPYQAPNLLGTVQCVYVIYAWTFRPPYLLTFGGMILQILSTLYFLVFIFQRTRSPSE